MTARLLQQIVDVVVDHPSSWFNHASSLHRVVVSMKGPRHQYMFLNSTLITTTHPLFPEGELTTRSGSGDTDPLAGAEAGAGCGSSSDGPAATDMSWSMTKVALGSEAEYRAQLKELVGIELSSDVHTVLFSDSASS